MEEIVPPKVPRSSKALHRAVEAGSVVKVKFLLWKGASVNARDCSTRTALHMACQSNTRETLRVIEVLLRSGAGVNVQDYWDRTPLHEACKMEFQSNITESANRKGQHLPDQSKKKSLQNVVEVLLKSGAEVNVQDYWGRTPLHEACSNVNPRLVITLLRNGAKIGLVDTYGKTPLHLTCSMGGNVSTIHVVNALLAEHADVDSEKICSPHLSYHPENSRFQHVVNLQDYFGNTALHLACENNNKEVVRMLLHKSAKVGVKNNNGMTALHSAVERFALDVVEVLLDNGEDVNAKDNRGNTPLHLLCSYKPVYKQFRHVYKFVDYMLSKGAKVHAKNDELETPYESLHRSICSHKLGWFFYDEVVKIEKIFINHEAKMNSLKSSGGLDMVWKFGTDLRRSVIRQCCQELEVMRNTKITEGISLHNVLSRTKKPYNITTDDLLHIDEVLSSPDLLKRFPLYGFSLRTTFQRPKLLTLAVQSFYTEGRKKMVKELPCEVTEQLMTYLTNEDLRRFLESEK